MQQLQGKQDFYPKLTITYALLQEFGHSYRRCTAEAAPTDDGGFGDISGGFENAPAAEGGWTGGDDAEAAPVEASGGW